MSAGIQFGSLSRLNCVQNFNDYELFIDENCIDRVLHSEHVNAVAWHDKQTASSLEFRGTQQTFGARKEGIGYQRFVGDGSSASLVSKSMKLFQNTLTIFLFKTS